MDQSGGPEEQLSCPALWGEGHCLLSLQPLGLPASERCVHAKPLSRSPKRGLSLAQTELQGKGTGRYVTFKKTAGMSEIATDTFIKCHHFCFSSTPSAYVILN